MEKKPQSSPISPVHINMNDEDFKIDIILEISYLNEGALQDLGSSSFKEHFNKAINLLSIWVNEKKYLSWDEDDVNFLNFLLHSRWLYKEDMFSSHSSLLKELLTKVTYPLITSLPNNDQFYNDLSYWFITQGEGIFKRLGLEKEREDVSLYLGKEKR